ncbi:MAG: PEP-CTERM sorting domain-containing protein [Armatimonadota bacterium]
MKRTALWVTLSLAAALLVATSASANLLVNGDFEDDNFGIPGWVPGWTIATFWWPGWGSQPPMLDRKTGYSTFTGTGIPFSGNYFLATDIAGHANYHVGAYQTFNVTPGATYLVTGGFMGGVQQSNDTAWWEVKVADGTTTDPDAPGTVIAKKERPAGQGFFQFREEFSGTFTANASTATIFLKWGRAQSADWVISAGGFDNLVVVPEPASILALASGLAGMAGLALRRRA